MSNWTNADFQSTFRTELDFARAARAHPPNKRVPVPGATRLGTLVNARMARALRKDKRSSTVGQFAFVKTLFRGSRGNSWISRQEFNITPARPYGSMPSGSRGTLAYPAR